MKTNEKQELIVRIARRSLVPIGILVAALCFADPSRAQLSPGSVPSLALKPADAALSKARAPLAIPQAPGRATATNPLAPDEENSASQAKGQHEGIKVHGHWIIEVKNPDGKVVTHREFENAIQQYGILYLSALLAGNNSPGGLSIALNGAHMITPDGSPVIELADSGPCLPLNLGISPGGVVGGPSSGTTCLITNIKSLLGASCNYLQQSNGSTSPLSPCSTNLSTSAPAFTASGITFTGPTSPTSSSSPLLVLSGSVTATSLNPGNINDVETVFTTCDTNSTPTNCLNSFNVQSATPVEINVFTQKLLDGKNGDPAAVPYIPGQSIFVTVQFTFQ